jgi:hypothetical protein
MEIWKPAYGFESSHEVSNLGNIRSYRRKHNVKFYPDKRGYLRFKIGTTTVKVHRIVAQTFIPNLENKPQVNHINANKIDNRVENLEWVTNKENMAHAVLAGIYTNNVGSKNWLDKKRKILCFDTKDFQKEFESIQSAAKYFNGHASNIHKALNGITTKSYGFYWKYI